MSPEDQRKASRIEGVSLDIPKQRAVLVVGVNGEDWGVGVAEVKPGGRRETKEQPPSVGPPAAAFTWESCRGLGQPKSAELELKLMAPRRLRTCWGTGLSRGSTGSW